MSLSAAFVTVLVRGETGAVNAAVRAGADACERVGDGQLLLTSLPAPTAKWSLPQQHFLVRRTEIVR